MGRTSREKPARLGEKLLQIRTSLGLSQDALVRHLGMEDRLSRDDISKYERGVREPSLIILLEYGKSAGLCLDYLVNDALELPVKLPSKPSHRI
jgi:transcriptional regulator with XRE-family HTH domain